MSIKHSIIVSSISVENGFKTQTTQSAKTLPVMHPEISAEMKRRQLHFLSPTYLRNRTGFHSNSLGNLKRFLVFYSPPLFAGFENPYLAIPNLAHLFFAKGCKKPNKLNYLPKK